MPATGRSASNVAPAARSSSAPPPRPLRRGKVKEVWEVSPTELEFVFTDDISVFDKHIPNAIPHKGETLARTSAFWFDLCTKQGVNHHFLRLSGPNKMRVRRVEVVPDPRSSGHPKRSLFIPLECVVRYYVAGSLWDRLQKGKIRPEDCGFPGAHVAAYGQKLPDPLFEFTTKLEPVDRLLTPSEALEVGGVTKKDISDIQEMILKIDGAMQRAISPRGLLHVDGKKEFAFDEHGKVMVVDTFGTADEDRFWEKDAYERGRFEEFSKEFVRQHYRHLGYYDNLQAARAAGKAEPDIPSLPPNLVQEVSKLYTTVFERLTGERFHPGGKA
ncbi:MAG: phosphoribosylaminoimidazolesuccinocarboxamide synthase [Euryarchaeota archaeon]|nr:phosphoribosylaminoimidazolesuccinocarboxamide synthase [Euryarchaeota archaeon]MDE1878925.1 phosphoribosylaminoimidazolesuccinocarboxamide synthase [Euryarchaeota archaeon]